MNSVFIAVVLLASLVVVALLGQGLRRRLPDHHLSADSRDAVKLAVGLVATMTALLLGLLAFSAKGIYDTRRTEVIEIAAKINLLDHVLTAYGPDAADARARLREAVAECIRQTWSDEAGAQATMAPIWQANFRFHSAILGLSPRDDAQREWKGGR